MTTDITNIRKDVAAQVDALGGEAAELLAGLIRIPSLSGEEEPAQSLLADWLRNRKMPVELMPADADLESDKDYSRHSGDGKHAPNLITYLPSEKLGRSLLLNSHTDVVPAKVKSMFDPQVDGDIIRGRGSADAKGQVVAMAVAMLAVMRSGAKLKGECIGAAVVEEEVGGNGALAYIRNCPPQDLCIVLEPTGLAIHPSNRGAIWFKVSVKGVSTHMGRWWEGKSAFENLEHIIRALRKWDERLVAESQGVPLFPDNPSPAHVNIGTVRAGDWPSTVPGTAEAEGGVSFLPNKNLQQIRREVTQVVSSAAAEIGSEAQVVFEKLQNEAYSCDLEHPGIRMLSDVSKQVLGTSEVSGFLASCDARLFYHRGGMPTIVFGPADLAMAHSDDEQISMTEVLQAAKVLAGFIVDWCEVA